MIQRTPQADEFKHQLRDSLQRETLNSRAIKVARHANVYSCGDQDEMVYFIESGQIKLRMLSSEGRECILAIHSAGDIFGELCLSGLGARLETATAMKINDPETNSLLSVLYPSEPRLAVRGLRALPRRPHCRSAAGYSQPGDGGQRAAAGKDLVTAGPHHGQERPAQHSHRTEDFTRRVVRDGGNDAAADQLVYAAIS
jgi:hypothetical protein